MLRLDALPPLLLLLAAAAAAAAAAPTPLPEPAILHAPFTPFHANFSLNTAPVAAMARRAAQAGVNVVWAGGGLGQFETLGVAERVAVFEAWVREGHANGLYVIAHVGANVQADALALARAAVRAGADAIAAVPEYYEATDNVDVVLDWLAPIAAAAPDTPFFYYHIPAETRCHVRMPDFLRAAPARLPTLRGVKWVEASPADFLNCTSTLPAGSPDYALLWAPEPKITSLALGGQGVVLAEDFYAQTYLRMAKAAAAGDSAAARQEQLWKERVMAVFARYGGGYAERYVYPRWAGVSLGPPRPPGQPLQPAQAADMMRELEAAGFFDQLQ